jgi:hypothetical protein
LELVRKDRWRLLDFHDLEVSNRVIELLGGRMGTGKVEIREERFRLPVLVVKIQRVSIVRKESKPDKMEWLGCLT